MKQDFTLLKWGYLLVLSLIWGSSFILIKKGLAGFGYVEAATIRLVSAGLLFLPFGIANRRNIPPEKRLYVLLAALLGMVFPAYLFCLAQQQVQSSVAGILNALTPAFTFVFSMLFFHTTYKIRQVVGLLLGLACAIMLALERADSALRFNWYAGLIVLATAFYGLNINLIKNKLGGIPAPTLSTVSVSVAGLLAFLLVLLPNLGHYTVTEASAAPFLALVTLGMLGTALAQLLHYKLISRTSALFGSSPTYIIPVVAVLWGVLDGEPFRLVHALSIGGILLAVILIRRG
ncbi:MAG TPA: DMT family transporter [Saprospiraceae bacterium]|nr:DMT family transporter [Saprospiraceae bacterium]